MYRIVEISNVLYAVELLTSGRTKEDEFHEIESYFDDGIEEVRIVSDYEDIGAQLVERDYL